MDSTAPDNGVVLDVRRGRLRCVILREQTTGLSPREMEIARMVAHGLPTKRIAHALGISVFTVNSHVRRIFTKLGVSSRAAMVAQLTQNGFVDLAVADQPSAGFHPVGEAEGVPVSLVVPAD